MLTDDQVFRQYLRDRSPQAWEAVVLRNFDYIQQRIAAFRFPSGRFIPEFDQGAVASEAWIRVQRLEFRGSSVGELRAAIGQTVWNACMDWGRRDLTYDRHIAGSLDEPGFDGEEGDRGRYEPELADVSRRLEAAAREDEDAEELRESEIALVRWAIKQVRNDNYREVLHMTLVQKAAAETIAERLNITLANVYQRRRRGILELEKILRDQRT
jgi:RNA polymerase sigma factor (sigma-70 family)